MIQGAIRIIQARTAEAFKVDLAGILSDQRTAGLAHARQAAMLISRKRTLCSLSVIARHFRRDHTTILHGVRAAQSRRETDEDYNAKLIAVENCLTFDVVVDTNTEAAADIIFHKLRSEIGGAVEGKLEKLRGEVFEALQDKPDLVQKILNRKVG